MSVYTLNLIWKRDGEDVELGSCFHTARPSAGELISYGSKHGGVRRVVTVYHQPFMPGSQTWRSWRSWRERGAEPEGGTDYWVEPAEGPWEP